MGNAHPEATHNLAIVDFHSLDGGPLRVNAFLVTAFGECSCGGTQIEFLNGQAQCVREDIYTTQLKLNRARRPLAERLKSFQRN